MAVTNMTETDVCMTVTDLNTMGTNVYTMVTNVYTMVTNVYTTVFDVNIGFGVTVKYWKYNWKYNNFSLRPPS